MIAGWVGRISREKGIDIFIDALASLNDRPIHAAILGDGPERTTEAARAESIAPSRFRWLGAVPEAARYFAAFDLFVLSSRTEGLPMVMLEAMAAGIPIVATNVGGIPDLLSPSEGLLVAPEDPGALAAAMRATLDDREAAEERARAARQRQKTEFDVGPWSARYESIYRDLIAQRASPGARTLVNIAPYVLIALPVAIFGWAYAGYPAVLWIASRFKAPFARLRPSRRAGR